MHFIVTILMVMLSLSVHAATIEKKEAVNKGWDVGNGGDAVKCVPSSDNHFVGYYSLDYVLSTGEDKQSESFVSVQSFADSIDRIKQALETKSPHLAKSLAAFIVAFNNQNNWVPSEQLNDLRDEEFAIYPPKNCQNNPQSQSGVYQAVIRRETNTHNVEFLVNRPVVSELQKNPLQLSFLLVHEWLWQYMADRSALDIRRINRLLHSDKVNRMSSAEFNLFLVNHGFDGNEIILNDIKDLSSLGYTVEQARRVNGIITDLAWQRNFPEFGDGQNLCMGFYDITFKNSSNQQQRLKKFAFANTAGSDCHGLATNLEKNWGLLDIIQVSNNSWNLLMLGNVVGQVSVNGQGQYTLMELCSGDYTEKCQMVGDGGNGVYLEPQFGTFQVAASTSAAKVRSGGERSALSSTVNINSQYAGPFAGWVLNQINVNTQDLDRHSRDGTLTMHFTLQKDGQKHEVTANISIQDNTVEMLEIKYDRYTVNSIVLLNRSLIVRKSTPLSQFDPATTKSALSTSGALDIHEAVQSVTMILLMNWYQGI